MVTRYHTKARVIDEQQIITYTGRCSRPLQ